jgi:single-strand DNA-binding protein
VSNGVNKVIILGNAGADPETVHLPNGGAITNVRIATSEQWKDKKTGKDEQRTEWHKIVFFGRLAEIAAQYVRKGSKIYIEGSIRTKKWQDKDGADRYSTEIIASSLQLLDSKGTHPQEQQQRQVPATNNDSQDFEDLPF